VPDIETISLAEDEESEVIIASSDSFTETIAPVSQPDVSATESRREQKQPEQHPGREEKKGKRKRWHPRKRRKKTQDNK
jgi:hypothetical protein